MLKRLLAAAVMAVALAGCALPTEKIQEAFGAEGHPRLAAYAMVAVVSELAADRVVRSDPGDAMPTYARVLRLVTALRAYEETAGDWPETATHDARREVSLAMSDIIGARADSLVQVNGRLDIGLDLVLTELDRVGKAAAMRRDIFVLTEAVSSGGRTEDEAVAILALRTARNLERLEALGGVR